MNVIELLEKFFRKNNHAISISNLYKILKIQDSDKDAFLDALFELEKAGKMNSMGRYFILIPQNEGNRP